MIVHAVAIVVVGLWVLVIIAGGIAESPNKGVVEKWIDNARMERESNGR